MPDFSKLKTGEQAFDEAEAFEVGGLSPSSTEVGLGRAGFYEPERDLMARVTNTDDLIAIRDFGVDRLIASYTRRTVIHYALKQLERHGSAPTREALGDYFGAAREDGWDGRPSDTPVAWVLERLYERSVRNMAQRRVTAAAYMIADDKPMDALRYLAEEITADPLFAGTFVLRSFEEVEDEGVSWLWKPWIPERAVTLLVGWPGEGKSMLTASLAARLSVGAEGFPHPAATIMLSAEDAHGAVIKPRLVAAGADLSKIHTVAVRRDGYEDGLWIPDDVPTLRMTAKKSGAKMIIIDPINAFLPESINSWSDQSVRRALRPLHDLATEYELAVVVVMHLNKSKDSNPHRRVGGSIGFEGAARSALIFGRDPDGVDPNERILAQSKSNYGQYAKSLRFMIESREYMSPHGLIETAVVIEDGESSLTAQNLLTEKAATGNAETTVLSVLPSEETDAVTAHDVVRRVAATGKTLAYNTVRNTLKLLHDATAIERTEKRPHRYWRPVVTDEELEEWLDG